LAGLPAGRHLRRLLPRRLLPPGGHPVTYQRTRGPLVTFYPRKAFASERNVTKWGADRENPQQVRVAFTADRMAKAEAMGQVEIETYVARFPWDTKGVGPGALIVW